MPEEPTSPTPPSDIPERLREVARLLRGAHHLGPEAQHSLAALAEKLAGNLAAREVPSTEEMQLGQLTSQVIQELHEADETPPPGATRHRLQEAIVAAEIRAPFAAGLAQQLLDVLANIGI
jgi:hypothetical protein